MSRADQASEPSMEDILASIRRIIADEDPPSEGEPKTPEARPATAGEREGQRNAGPGLPPQPGARPAGTLSAFSGRPAPRPERPRLSGFSAAEPPSKPATPVVSAPPPPARNAAQTDPRIAPAPQAAPQPPQSPLAADRSAVAPGEAADDVLELTDELILLHPEDAHAPQAASPSAGPERAEAAQQSQPGAGKPAPAEASAVARAPAAVAQMLFSPPAGRGAPPAGESAFPFAPPADSGRPFWSRRDAAGEPASSPAAAQPAARGGAPRAEPEPPVRWPGDFQAQIPADGPRAPFADFEESPAGSETARSDAGQGMEEKVETLARTAVTALRDEELVEAQQVDFGSLDAGRRDAVAQSFIRAVAGQDTDDAGSEAPGGEVWAPDAELPEQGGAGISAPEQAAPAPSARAQQASAASLPAASTPAVARAQPQPNAPQPVVTATFAPAVPAQPVGRSMTLEDSVREMLRPMLAEWLNQHMPRILEDAIRQEIKARGLPWDGGKTS